MPKPIEAWWRGLRWVQAVLMEADRFVEVAEEFHQADLDAQLRVQMNTDTPVAAAWRAEYEQLPLGERPVRVPSLALRMQIANEIHLLVIAVHNLLNAEKRLPKKLRPGLIGGRELTLLRNTAEHWEDTNGRSISKLRKEHPDFEYESVAFSKNELWIGGVHGVPISRIREWAVEMWKALSLVLTKEGEPVLNNFGESIIEGDDALAWPRERVRFHWSLPRIEVDQWPREPMPDKVAEALGTLFQRTRMRDGGAG